MISTLYAAAARRRREWYAARPEARRRLRRPVISVGNIAVGGRGKTPFAAAVARALLHLGERPAVLSRGYGRAEPVDGVVVVRDVGGLRADVARAGDEPFMLARQLDGAIVMSAPDRYASGRLAEHHLGATVHVLDDGFQHFVLDRDADIVLVSASDLEASTLPSGRLREPPDVLVAADAIVCVDEEVEIPTLDVPVFHARRSLGAVVFETDGHAVDAAIPVLAFAGIAEPRRFFAGAASRYEVRRTRAFRDHHPYSAAEVAALTGEAKACGAAALITTEKDYVRLLRHRPFAMPIGWLPLTITPEPEDDFRRWLAAAVAAARDVVIA